MPRYKIIEIYTREEAKWRRRPVHSAVVEYVNSLKIAARTIVTRGIAGSYEDGEIASGGIFSKKPVHTTIILAADYSDDILSKVREMVTEGTVTARDVEVLVHKTHGLDYVQDDQADRIITPGQRL